MTLHFNLNKAALVKSLGSIVKISGVLAYCLYFCVLTTFATTGVPPENFDVLRAKASKFVSETVEASLKAGISQSVLKMSPHSASWLFEQEFVNKSKELGFKIITTKADSASEEPAITVAISKFGVRYGEYSSSNDTIIRTILFECTSYSNKGKELTLLASNNLAITDTLDRKDIARVESTPYDFAKAILPPVHRSIWEKAIEPVILVASAALIVLLFFTVRSAN